MRPPVIQRFVWNVSDGTTVAALTVDHPRTVVTVGFLYNYLSELPFIMDTWRDKSFRPQSPVLINSVRFQIQGAENWSLILPQLVDYLNSLAEAKEVDPYPPQVEANFGTPVRLYKERTRGAGFMGQFYGVNGTITEIDGHKYLSYGIKLLDIESRAADEFEILTQEEHTS